jgi:hypothetical protein
MALRASYLRRFPLPLPASCRGNGKRNGNRTASERGPLLRQGSRSSERPSRTLRAAYAVAYRVANA